MVEGSSRSARPFSQSMGQSPVMQRPPPGTSAIRRQLSPPSTPASPTPSASYTYQMPQTFSGPPADRPNSSRFGILDSEDDSLRYRLPLDVGGVKRQDSYGKITTRGVTYDVEAQPPRMSKITKEYSVSVHLIEGRDFPARLPNSPPDPIVVISTANQEFHTSPLQSRECMWDCFFRATLNLTEEQFTSQQLRISVYDVQSGRRHNLIGSYAFDLANIHKQPGHEVYRNWIALQHPSDSGSVHGFLKVSAIVLGPKDRPVAREEDGVLTMQTARVAPPPVSDHGVTSPVLISPDVQPKGFLLRVRCFKAEDLPKMDRMGKCDAYVAASIGNQPSAKTKVVKRSFSPTFNQELVVPVVVPSAEDKILITLWDWDRTDDQLIGTIFFRLSDVLNSSFGPAWVPVYGPKDPIQVLAENLTENMKKTLATSRSINPKQDLHFHTLVKKDMLMGLREGSAYNGRLLLEVVAEMQSSLSLPSPSVHDYPQLHTHMPESTYVLRVDLYEGAEFPIKFYNHDIFVEVTVGPFTKRSNSVKAKHGNPMWYDAFPEVEVVLPRDKTQIPDVFVDVYMKKTMGENVRIGYLRFQAIQLLSTDRTPHWFQLTLDVEKQTVVQKNEVAGFLLLNIGLASTPLERRQREQLQPPNVRTYELRAHIYQAKNLRPALPDELNCNAYCLLRLGTAHKQTTRREDTNFPNWYETVTVRSDVSKDLNLAPELYLEVYDYDEGGYDALIGKTKMSLKSLGHEFAGKPTWLPLLQDDLEAMFGEILVSFQFLPIAEAPRYPIPDITPASRECTLEFSAISLLNVLPAGRYAVNAPFLEVDIGGQKLQNVTHAVTTKASNTPSSTNPYFLENHRFGLVCPVDPLFAPYVVVRVFDRQLGGDTSPSLGEAVISLADLLPWHDYSLSHASATRGISTDATSLLSPTKQRSLSGNQSQLALTTMDGKIPVRITPIPEAFPIGTENVNMSISDTHQVVLDRELEQVVQLDFHEHVLRRFTRKREMSVTLDQSMSPRWMVQASGKFKGGVRILDHKNEYPLRAPLDLEAMFSPRRYTVRVYVMRLYDIVSSAVAQKERGNKPGLFISLSLSGDDGMRIDDMGNVFRGGTDIVVKHVYELTGQFPGNGDMKITLNELDKYNRAEKIGSTNIDLESRWFSDKWRSTPMKPIEIREMWSATSVQPQAKMDMWVEIIPEDQAAETPRTPFPKGLGQPFELRVVIWSVRGVNPRASSTTGQRRGVFVSAHLDGHEPQVTDVDPEPIDSQATFNWRMKFPVKLPSKASKFHLLVWTDGNDQNAVAEAVINLGQLFQKAHQVHQDVPLPKQWMTLYDTELDRSLGQVEVTFQLLPHSDAQKKKNGYGRAAPNQYPVLPHPVRPNMPVAVQPPPPVPKKRCCDALCADVSDKQLKQIYLTLIVLLVLLVIVLVAFAVTK